MGDLLQQGSQWLAQQRGAHCASQVTYRRGETELALNATFGRPDREVEDELGVRVGVTMTDFLVASSDFTPTFGEPQPGDQVIAPSAGSGQGDSTVYEVLDLAGQGHWRWSGVPGTTMRIHTKQVGTETP